MSMSMKNFSPGCRYPETDAIHSDFFWDWKATSASKDHWKDDFSAVSCVSAFARSVNSAANLH
jgi:hypothetical protein